MPDEYKIDVLDETTHRIHRSVRLSESRLSPGGATMFGGPIEVHVYVYTEGQALSDTQPEMRIGRSDPLTRAQWEIVKRLGDAAWDEFEKRFPK